MKNPITIVAGLPRCGSSLVMQMLAVAGFRCAGEYPGFEPEESIESPPPEFVDSFAGGAMKVLAPQRVLLPPGRDYRFIFLTRSRRQQAQSLIKFIQATGNAQGRTISQDGFDRMKESLRNDQAAALKIIEAHECPVIRIRFEDLIERSMLAVIAMVRFLDFEHDEERMEAMMKVIRPRSAQCYAGLLEIDLMEEMYAAEEKTTEEKADEELPPFDPLLCTCHIPPYPSPCSYCESGTFAR